VNIVGRGDLDKVTANELALAIGKLEIATAAVEVIPSFRETSEYYAARSTSSNLVDLVRVAVKETRDKFRSNVPRIVVESESAVVHVRVYRPRVVQAFANIITNAIEALHADSEQRRTPLIRIVCEVDDSTQRAVVRVHDNGAGMLPDVLQRATSPAYSTKGHGSANRGMGLYIARRIIEGHSGSISITSVVGQFTEVSVALPVETRRKRDSQV
jgi:two-component system sensor histidine kinase PhcS